MRISQFQVSPVNAGKLVLAKHASRRDEDIALWEQWKKTGSNVDLNKLFAAFEGLINSNINKWRSHARIPAAAMRAEAEKLTLEAFIRYNPLLGASLASYVDTWLQKLYGFVNSRGNIMKIPEDRISMIGRFQDTESRLKKKLRREPNASEIADSMGIPTKEVNRFRKEAFGILTEGGLKTDFSGINVLDPSVKHAVSTVYFDLGPEEKIVYEYLYGVYGRMQLSSTNDIAKATGYTASKVSRLKGKISKKLAEYLD